MRGLGVIPEEKPSTRIDGFSRQSVLAHREKRVFGAGSCDRPGRPRTSQNVPGRSRASQSVPEPSRMAQSVPERPRASQPPENVPERARAFHSVRELPGLYRSPFWNSGLPLTSLHLRCLSLPPTASQNLPERMRRHHRTTRLDSKMVQPGIRRPGLSQASQTTVVEVEASPDLPSPP